MILFGGGSTVCAAFGSAFGGSCDTDPLPDAGCGTDPLLDAGCGTDPLPDAGCGTDQLPDAGSILILLGEGAGGDLIVASGPACA